MAKTLENLKVAIVTDWLTDRGGAERVILALAELFPQADIFTTVYRAENFLELAARKVQPTYMQNWPLKFRHQLFAWARPQAIESINVDGYDLVISSSSAEAKGVLTKPETVHICYCHTPTRYYWSHYHEYLRSGQFGLMDGLIKLIAPKLIHNLRIWDRVAADRVDFYIANSRHTRNRIRKYYEANSTIIHPPVDLGRFSAANVQGDYYLVVGRLIAYKRTDLVIEAFNSLNLPLKVIGSGPELERLRHLAVSDKIEFLGRQDDDKVADYMMRCKAVIFPQEEDFGIVPLEAMAAGKPVIAYGAGGATETVIDGQTGLLFSEQTVGSLREAVAKFETMTFSPAASIEQAKKFSKEIFQQKMAEFISKVMGISS